jgi:hypothetical protein
MTIFRFTIEYHPQLGSGQSQIAFSIFDLKNWTIFSQSFSVLSYSAHWRRVFYQIWGFIVIVLQIWPQGGWQECGPTVTFDPFHWRDSKSQSMNIDEYRWISMKIDESEDLGSLWKVLSSISGEKICSPVHNFFAATVQGASVAVSGRVLSRRSRIIIWHRHINSHFLSRNRFQRKSLSWRTFAFTSPRRRLLHCPSSSQSNELWSPRVRKGLALSITSDRRHICIKLCTFSCLSDACAQAEGIIVLRSWQNETECGQ